MEFPIIRIQVEGMKHTIMLAMEQHLMKMDEDVKRAVEEACTPERVTAVIRNAAETEVKKAIESEVQNFYRSGAGRQAVRDAVAASLEARADEFKKWGE